MATKPNETYKWGENATHEQVAAYEDTGWPSDAIPPKRTQFNWYQNLVGKWLEWTEDTVDELVTTVLSRWFIGVANVQSVPNETGIYKHQIDHRFYLVHDGHMATVGFDNIYFTSSFYTWDGSQWVENIAYSFTRANTRSDILQESEANYVTPKGLVDYFNVPSTTYYDPLLVPHQTGVYLIRYITRAGVSIVIGDNQVYIETVDPINSRAYKWENDEWVEQ